MLVSLKIPAGVYRQGTEYQSQGRYYDADLMRWFEGTLRPVGGWRQYRTATNEPVSFTGVSRGIHAWRNNGADRYVAVGTHTKLFAVGSSIVGAKDISPAGLATGFISNNVNSGYGGGVYGVNTYGTARTSTNITQFATTWALDNFGEFLVAVQSEDGRLFYWDLMTATAVPVVATAGTVPVNNKGVIVSDERFVFLLQAGGNRRRIAWSDQENLFNWQVTATTQAGDFELATPGEIMQAVKVRGQMLFLTSTDAFAAQYIGPPLVYGFERVGDGCGCVSRNAAVVADKLAFWMNDNGFFAYDGFVKNLPSEVGDYVFSRINRSQLQKVWAVHNNDFGEVTWYYPAGMEIDSYVTYNYRENHWSIGGMDRSIGVDSNVFPLPLRVGFDGFLYEHEIGFSYENRQPYAQTGPVEINGGSNVYMAKYLYPDEKQQGTIFFGFTPKLYPNAEDFQYVNYDSTNPTSIRVTGRQLSIRIQAVPESNLAKADKLSRLLVDDMGTTLVISRNALFGQDFRIGNVRMDVEIGGMR
jgi:hypothetical protein